MSVFFVILSIVFATCSLFCSLSLRLAVFLLQLLLLASNNLAQETFSASGNVCEKKMLQPVPRSTCSFSVLIAVFPSKLPVFHPQLAVFHPQLFVCLQLSRLATFSATFSYSQLSMRKKFRSSIVQLCFRDQVFAA